MLEIKIQHFILARAKVLNRTSGRNALYVKFGFIRISSFSTVSAFLEQ
jgi:hypothetical protein